MTGKRVPPVLQRVRRRIHRLGAGIEARAGSPQQRRAIFCVAILLGSVVGVTLLALPAAAGTQSPDSVSVGETFEASVYSTNDEDSPENYENDPCYGNEGVNTDKDPDVSLDSSLTLVEKKGWTYTGGVVGYEFPIDIKADEEDDSASITFTVYCNDGTSDSESTSVTVNPAVDAEITGFSVDGGTYQPGDTVDATATVKNTGGSEHTFFVGYSVKGPDDEWRDNGDSTGKSMTLDPGETRDVNLEWTVEDDAPEGSYDARTSVWEESDRNNLDTRLDDERDNDAFEVEEEPKPPSVSTSGSEDVKKTSATMVGTLEDLGGADSVDVGFEYRKEGASNWQESFTVSEDNTGEFSLVIDSLDSDTTYEFRALAESSVDTDRGSIKTFTTDEEEYSISVDLKNSDAKVELNGQTFSSDIKKHYTAGTDVTVKALPPDGYSFDHWEGDYPSGEQSSQSITVTMDQNKQLSAYFTEDTSKPAVSTDTASGVGKHEAQLEGTLDSTGGTDSIDVWFKYREEGNSNWQTSSTKSLSSTTGFSISVSNLNTGTTYEFRAVAKNSDGTAKGEVKTFTTQEEATDTTVTTEDSHGVEENTAVLDGDLQDLGSADSADVWFEYREEGANDWQTSAKETYGVSTGFSISVDGLRPDTTYEFRAVAENEAGVDEGQIKTFTTQEADAPPQITTDGARNVESESAILDETIQDKGSESTVTAWFEYRQKGDSTWQETTHTSYTSKTEISHEVSDLESDTTYEFRAVAENDVGTDTGEIKEFTTVEASNPDLTIDDIRWSPDTPKEGEDVAFTVEVRNIGGTSVTGADLELRVGSEFYQVTDVALDTDETDTITVTESWTADPDIDEVTAEIDPDNEVEEVDETNNQRTESLDFGQGTGVIAGTVTDADGNPVQGATVTLKTGRTTTTGSNGEFGFEEVAIGQHQLTVTKDGFQDAETKVAIEAEDLVTPEIALEREAAGVITAIEGVPTTYTENEWFEVRVTVRNTGATGQTYIVEVPTPSGVDIDGTNRQRVRVDAGETRTVAYRVQFYGTETIREFTAELYSESGELLDEQSVESQPRETVSFTVAAELPDGQSISDATVKLVEGAQAQEVREQQTNEDGEVTFKELPAGRYAVQVIANNIFGNDKVKRAKVVDVGPDGTTRTVFALQLSASFSGTVVTEDGDPVENAEVVVGGKSTLTNPDGEFEFEGGLPSRKHVVEVYLDDNLVWQKEMQLQAGPNQHLLEVPPEPGRAEIFSEALLNEMRGAVYGDYGIKHDKPGSDTIPYFLGWLGYSVAPYVDLPADARDCMVWIPGDEVWDTADCGSLGLSVIGLGVITVPAEVGEQPLDVASKTNKFVAHTPEKTPEVVKVLSQKLGDRFEDVLAKIDDRAPDTADKLRKAHLRHKTGLTGKQLDEAARLNKKGVGSGTITQLRQKGVKLENVRNAVKRGDEVIYLKHGDKNSGWTHIEGKHIKGTTHNDEFSSFFPTGKEIKRGERIEELPNTMTKSEVEELIMDTIKKDESPLLKNERAEYVIDPTKHGYDVGITEVRVVVLNNGEVHTAFPERGSKVWQYRPDGSWKKGVS